MFQKTADEASAGLYSLQFQNIGTPSVQELFFCDRSISRTVYSNDLFKIFGCDVQQERNWEESKHLVGTIEFTPL